MSSSDTKHFRKTRHVIDASHLRQYPRALAVDEHHPLKLAVDQLTPKDNPQPSPGDVTLIAAHANGVGKELYEPLWDDLYEAARGAFRIRNIWIMDVAWQGQGAVLNEDALGDDPSWYDTPRDLFVMINHFRADMKTPLIGLGHSMGGNNIVALANMHPRLFTALILVDPVIQRFISILGNYTPAYASSIRRDIWPSREEAARAFKRSKFFQRWDQRVFDLWIQHGLRELPTAIYPSNPDSNKLASPTDKPVTLTTPKHQEVFTFLRSNHPKAHEPLSEHVPTRRTHPDLPAANPAKPFYRPESLITFSLLPHLRPRCLYLFPEDSTVCPPAAIKDKLDVTGTGVGGNGGVAEGGTTSTILPGAGHFVPFEQPGVVAAQMAAYAGEELARWRRDAALDAAEAAALRSREKFTLSEDRMCWMRTNQEAIKKGQQQGREGKGKAKL